MDIWEIKEKMGLKAQDHPTMLRFIGVFSTGDMGPALFDYDAGILSVRIVPSFCGEDKWIPMVSITTIDDGGWQAFHPNTMSLGEANSIIVKIFQAWEWKTKLPSEKELNEFLMPFGLWGECTG